MYLVDNVYNSELSLPKTNMKKYKVNFIWIGYVFTKPLTLKSNMLRIFRKKKQILFTYLQKKMIFIFLFFFTHNLLVKLILVKVSLTIIGNFLVKYSLPINFHLPVNINYIIIILII